MRILGIDPGTSIVGWGVIEKIGDKTVALGYDSIINSKERSLSQKLENIYEELEKIIKTYEPTIAAVEEIFFVKNVKTATSVGHARGVILLAIQRAGIELFEYKPLEIKQAVVGYGHADKSQVQIMVKNILKLNQIPKPDDTADALAVALCHSFRSKWNDILKKSGCKK